MVRIAIKKWFSVIQNGRWEPFCKKKLRIDLKWREMRSKVIFGHPKWPPAAILWKKIKKIKFAYWSEIAKCDRKWCSVIQNGRRQPFCEFKKKIKIAYWSEMARNVIERDFRSSKMAAAILWKKKVAYSSEMARNAIKSDFRSSKMATGSHFVKKNKSCVLISNGEKWDQKWFSVIQNGRRQPFSEKYQSCVLIWNDVKCDRKWFSVILNGRRQPFCEQIQNK